MRNKRGFTLVEMIIVMAIIVILAIVATSAIDPAALTNKGGDARRKKDLARIKVAFEEYFNDKGCYPTRDEIEGYVENGERKGYFLMDKASCGSKVFSPWLESWPCDPKGGVYYITSEGRTNCPKWFSAMTKLMNEKDGDIARGRDQYDSFWSQTTDMVSGLNYGVSSGNVNWWTEKVIPDDCYASGEICSTGCLDRCQEATTGCNSSTTTGCFIGNRSGPDARRCQVSCCGQGCE